MDDKNAPKKTRATFKRNNKYRKPEIENRVVNLRADGNSWDKITEILRGELDEPRMCRDTPIKIYNRAMSKTIIRESREGKSYTDHTDALDKINGESIAILGRFTNAMLKITEQLERAVDSGDMEIMKVFGIYIKSSAAMKTILSENREYMKMNREQQAKIIEQVEGRIWDESQMLYSIDKTLNKLEKDGIIRIIKPELM